MLEFFTEVYNFWICVRLGFISFKCATAESVEAGDFDSLCDEV